MPIAPARRRHFEKLETCTMEYHGMLAMVTFSEKRQLYRCYRGPQVQSQACLNDTMISVRLLKRVSNLLNGTDGLAHFDSHACFLPAAYKNCVVPHVSCQSVPFASWSGSNQGWPMCSRCPTPVPHSPQSSSTMRIIHKYHKQSPVLGSPRGTKLCVARKNVSSPPHPELAGISICPGSRSRHSWHALK